MSLNNFSAIKEFFEKIDTSNKSCVKIQTCFVIYKTNIKDLNFNQNTKVTVNISSRDYYSIELNDLEEEKKSKFSEYIWKKTHSFDLQNWGAT